MIQQTPSKPILHFASRNSPLARAQCEECFALLKAFYPTLTPYVTYVESHGDKDLSRSLRDMGQTDFFTREVDALVLEDACDIALHSAKDLPHPLSDRLSLIALTRSIDSTDSLVLRPGETLECLPPGARIATSSLRREEAVLKLSPNVTCIDVRGTIESRLALLEDGRADGVVVAHAALLRLKLQRLNYITLPGQTAALQGSLALIAKNTRPDLAQLVACIDMRLSSR